MIGVKKKEDVFYSMFIDFAGKILNVGENMADLMHNFENVEDKAAHMKVLETECDMETHKILKSLRESFITPFDREDIYSIAREMDNIVDSIEETANRMLLFDIKEIRPDAITMTDMTVQAMREMETMFTHLVEIKKNSIVMEQVIEVNRIENEGDIVYRQALMKLFREEKDPIELIKWKHLYEQIECSLDSCENVANILEGVVAKYV